jgi:hypothetical protein
MRFHPKVFPMEGWSKGRPNLQYLNLLARSWVARGDRRGGEQAKEDYRRAIRLGRLLRQDDVWVFQDIVGLTSIEMGARGLYRVARKEGDAATMVVAATILGATENLRTWDGLEGQPGMQVLHRLKGGRRPRLEGVRDIDVEVLANRTKSNKTRRFRMANMEALWVVRHAGSRKQRELARETLELLAQDPDPVVASEARWYLERDWDPEAPIARVIKRMG